MTQGEIQRDFAAGILSAREAADLSIALGPRRSRVTAFLVAVSPALIVAAAYALIAWGLSGPR